MTSPNSMGSDRAALAGDEGREDTKRLDWMEKHGTARLYRVKAEYRKDPARPWRWCPKGADDEHYPTLRAAIDAAMAASQGEHQEKQG